MKQPDEFGALEVILVSDIELDSVTLTFQYHKIKLKCYYWRDLLDPFTGDLQNFWTLWQYHDIVTMKVVSSGPQSECLEVT